MVTLYHVYRMICLYQDIFDNDGHINNILFKFFSHKLLVGICDNKT